MKSKEASLTTPSALESVGDENQKQELTAKEKEQVAGLEDGLRQTTNEAEVISPRKKDKEKETVRGKLAKAEAYVLMFITLMTSMGAFAENAHANELGRIAGKATERLLNGGYTLQESEMLRREAINGYIRTMRMQQNMQQRDMSNQQQYDERAANAQEQGINNYVNTIQETKKRNYDAEVNRIMNSNMDAYQRQAALERARSLLN